jgi:hypothetical protein
MVLVISERCSCGAKFSVHDCDLADAKKLVREWRRSHECSSSDTAEFAGSTTGAVIERDTVGFVRNNFSEEE